MIEKSKGLGDDIANIIKIVYNPNRNECEGCKARRERLNKLFPKKK